MGSGDTTDPESPTNPTDPTAEDTPKNCEDMLMNCAISKLKADRTPIPDNRFTLPPEYGVNGGGPSDAFNGHEYVDLGLPSGTLWAKMNVGAESETDAGLYFAWGETQGYTASQVGTDKNFSPEDYALTEDGGSTFTKYNAIDGKTTLDLEDDAAHVNMGGDWHMPNNAQYFELLKETKNGFVTNEGAFIQYTWDNTEGYSSTTETTATISNWDTEGYFFFKNTYTSVTDAISAEDYLFIPAAGSCGDGEISEAIVVWSSFLNTRNIGDAWYFSSSPIRANVIKDARFFGQSVRGVVGQMDEITPGGGGESGPIK